MSVLDPGNVNPTDWLVQTEVLWRATVQHNIKSWAMVELEPLKKGQRVQNQGSLFLVSSE